MSRKCVISGKSPLSGNNVSHAHNKVKKRQCPNLHTRRLYVPILNRIVRIKVSAHSLRSINKLGLLAYLRKKNLQLRDIL